MPGKRKKTSIQKDVKTYKGHKRKNRPLNSPEKIIPGAQFYKEPQRKKKDGGKNPKEGHIPIKSQKQSYWRGNQGGWSITVQKPQKKIQP